MTWCLEAQLIESNNQSANVSGDWINPGSGYWTDITDCHTDPDSTVHVFIAPWC